MIVMLWAKLLCSALLPVVSGTKLRREHLAGWSTAPTSQPADPCVKFFFFHVPKSGGTSVNNWIQAAFDPAVDFRKKSFGRHAFSRVVHAMENKTHNPGREAWVQHMETDCGNMSGTVNGVLPAELTCWSYIQKLAKIRNSWAQESYDCRIVLATMLRDPVQQLASDFEYTDGYAGMFPPSIAGFSKFVDLQILGLKYASPATFTDIQTSFFINGYRAPDPCNYWESTYDASSLVDVAPPREKCAAKYSGFPLALIEAMDVVGTVADFEESICRMAQAAGFTNYSVTHANHGRLDLAEAVAANTSLSTRAKALLHHDTELYALAVKTLRQHSTCVGTLDRL